MARKEEGAHMPDYFWPSGLPEKEVLDVICKDSKSIPLRQLLAHTLIEEAEKIIQDLERDRPRVRTHEKMAMEGFRLVGLDLLFANSAVSDGPAAAQMYAGYCLNVKSHTPTTELHMKEIQRAYEKQMAKARASLSFDPTGLHWLQTGLRELQRYFNLNQISEATGFEAGIKRYTALRFQAITHGASFELRRTKIPAPLLRAKFVLQPTTQQFLTEAVEIGPRWITRHL